MPEPLLPILQVDPPLERRHTTARRPEWLKVRLPGGENYNELKRLMRGLDLHTVCESARCPNIAECWQHRTATFMILGNTCTRSCGFCAVPSGRPEPIDRDEPRRVAEAAEQMGLRYAVITSVNRDDAPDGGAGVFAETIREIRARLPECKIEVLIPDLCGDWDALKIVMDAAPDVLNHNTETVPRLYRFARKGAEYRRTLRLFVESKRLAPKIPTKTGLMAGLGETRSELMRTIRDIREQDVNILTVGQYLQPTRAHLPVAKFYTPEEFADIKQEAMNLGFAHVESGPLVRSSYHAHEQQEAATSGLL